MFLFPTQDAAVTNMFTDVLDMHCMKILNLIDIYVFDFSSFTLSAHVLREINAKIQYLLEY